MVVFIPTTASHITPVPEGAQLVSVKECQLANYKENPEDKAIVGILLSVRHASAVETDSKKYTFTGSSTYQQRGNARTKSTGQKGYDRIFIFGDVLTPWNCFTIICAKHIESVRLLNACSRSQEGVGNIFFAFEPDMIEYYLGSTNSIAIVTGQSNFLPLTNSLKDTVQSCPLQRPAADETNYFCIHNTKIRCQRANITQGSCAGIFCDRQQTNLSGSQSCGCLYMNTDGRSDAVLEMDVTFSVDSTYQPNGKMTIPHFRSWRTSNLFIQDKTTWSLLSKDKENENENRMTIRKTVSDITALINKSEGWTIIGWIRTGTVQDSSLNTTAPETLESLESRPHISYLFPSDPKITEDPKFKSLQLIKQVQEVLPNSVTI
jgi:hypothetical protein